jgi:hypothetical protein
LANGRPRVTAGKGCHEGVDHVRRVRNHRRPGCHRHRLIEKKFSSTLSLVVFLALFFTNFAVSWLAVIFVMDGSLKDAQGRHAQAEIERAARAARPQA